jgi:hypothetical protein
MHAQSGKLFETALENACEWNSSALQPAYEFSREWGCKKSLTVQQGIY